LVIILGLNKNFVSIRWKLVSTYLILIVICLILANSFIGEAMRKSNINEKKVHLFSQANIIVDRIVTYNYELNTNQDESIDQLIKMYSKEMKSRVMILNNKGMVVSDSYDIFNGKNLSHMEIEEALDGISIAKQHMLKDYGRTMYVAVPIMINNKVQGVVFISSSLEGLYANISEILKDYVLLSFLSITITGLISFVFAHFIANPIEKLTDSINKIYLGNMDQKVEISGNDELSNLGKAFNLMSTKLSQVDKQRKNFVANVSHELKTPLSAMKILSESLLLQQNAEVDTYREFLTDIDSEVDRLNKIIENLLALVDIDKEKLQLDYQITYVNYLVERLIHSLKPLADKKNIIIHLHETEKIQIELDQLKIQQALVNIIYNAIKYTHDGGIINIWLYLEQEYVVVKIEDNGIGIPEESIHHIFEKFYRVDKARSRNTGGTGLGLSIAQQIILLHQGTIKVTSQVNQGTTFYVRLPR